MNHKLNGKPFDVVNYLLHLKHLRNISNRRNLYPVFPIKFKSIQSKEYNEKEEEGKRIHNALRTNNKVIHRITAKSISQIRLSDKSKEFIDQMRLYRSIEENKLKKQNEELRAQVKAIQRMNAKERYERNNHAFVSPYSKLNLRSSGNNNEI